MTDLQKIQSILSETFEAIMEDYGDTHKIRLMIVNYTLGYMGASYGLHIEPEYPEQKGVN